MMEHHQWALPHEEFYLVPTPGQENTPRDGKKPRREALLDSSHR